MSIKKDLEKPIGIRGKFLSLIIQVGWPFLIIFLVLISIIAFDVKYALDKTNNKSVISRESLDLLIRNINRESASIINNGTTIASLVLETDISTAKRFTQRLLLTKPQFSRVIYYNSNVKKEWQVDSIAGDSLSNIEPIRIVPDYIYSEDYEDKINNATLHRTFFPIYSEDGKSNGFIEIVFDVSYFWNSISQLEDDSVYLYNKKGQMILSKENIKEQRKNEAKIFELYSTRLSEYNNFKDSSGVDIVGFSSEIPQSDWIIIVEKSLKELSLESRKIAINSIILIIFLVILIIIEIHIFSSKVYNPLRSLEDVSFKVSKGDYDSWSISWTGNEFDMVAMAMNQVVFNIKTLQEDFDKQITEKTKTLEDKIKDSEIMGSFMINRELRMIDIKNELARTKEDLAKCKTGKIKNINTEAKDKKDGVLKDEEVKITEDVSVKDSQNNSNLDN